MEERRVERQREGTEGGNREGKDREEGTDRGEE